MKRTSSTVEMPGLIKDVCMELLGHADDNEVRLLMGTSAAESGLVFNVQLDGGPARGLWQMEPKTGLDIFQNFLKYRLDIYSKLIYIWLDMNWLNFCPPIWIPRKETIERHLERYDDFACAMARIHYLRDPDPIPESVEDQAAYWKRVYNTEAGAGTVEHYLETWRVCECEELLEGSPPSI